MVQRPLVSVIVLCYNNYMYLKETLWSVIGQDYPRIQIIISDDASDYFPVDELVEFLNAARTPKLESIIINVNEKNLGTVRHLEHMREKCKGEYIVAIAGDDVFFDTKVISQFVDEMERLGEDAEIITAQTEMWDINLKNQYEDFVSQKDIEFIKNSSPQVLYEELVLRCFIPALCFCRRSFYNKIGSLPSSYKIIEDWSTYLRASRLGIKIHWLDIVSIKHRDGGVSHGNKANSGEVYLKYRSDYKYIYEQEVLPYLNLFSQQTADKIIDYFDYHLKHYAREFEKMQKTEKKIKRSATGTNTTVSDNTVTQSKKSKKEKAAKREKHGRLMFNIIYKFTRKNYVILAFASSLMLFVTAGIMSIPNDTYSDFFYILFIYLGCFALLGSITTLIANLIIKFKYR